MHNNVQESQALQLCKDALNKWIERLGLAWWDIEVHYYDNPSETVRLFRQFDNGDVVPAFVTANWMYASAKISVNLPAMEGMDAREVEQVIVHELGHILINEMREGEIHHEERVVTTLTKAFFWLEAAVKGETEGAASAEGRVL